MANFVKERTEVEILGATYIFQLEERWTPVLVAASGTQYREVYHVISLLDLDDNLIAEYPLGEKAKAIEKARRRWNNATWAIKRALRNRFRWSDERKKPTSV